MIARISGVVVEREEGAFIIDVRGVGYRVFVGSDVRERMQQGEEVTLRIYHHITDSGQLLFGFDDAKELEFFELLMTVPSIGARTARNILDAAPPNVLEQAVSESDTAVLTKVSGVGKRTAQRLIVELKEKISLPERTSSVPSALRQETVEALVSIGYSPAQAGKAVQGLSKEIDSVEHAVKTILQSAES